MTIDVKNLDMLVMLRVLDTAQRAKDLMVMSAVKLDFMVSVDRTHPHFLQLHLLKLLIVSIARHQESVYLGFYVCFAPATLAMNFVALNLSHTFATYKMLASCDHRLVLSLINIFLAVGAPEHHLALMRIGCQRR